MVATVKIIPFAAPGAALAAALRAAPARRRGRRSRRIRPLRIGVVSTLLPGLKPSVVAKTLRVLEARLAPAGATIVARGSRRARRRRRSRGRSSASRPMRRARRLRRLGDHRPARRHSRRRSRRAAAGSSISACRSIPAICCCSAQLGDKPVIGAPGCARSPKENGFDWVLGAHARRRADHARRHPGDGRRRPADGDRVAAAAAPRR